MDDFISGWGRSTLGLLRLDEVPFLISVAMSKSLLVVFVAASILGNFSSSESSGRMVKPCPTRTSSHAEARDFGAVTGVSRRESTFRVYISDLERECNSQ